MDAMKLKAKELKDRSYLIPELVVFWGKTPTRILDAIDTVLTDENLIHERFGFLKHLAYRTQAEFNALKETPTVRAALTAYGEAELRKKLAQMKKMISANPQAPFAYASTGLFYGFGEACGKVAYLFPGQGAQYLGMGGPLAAAFPEAARAWDKLGEMRFNGESIREVVFPQKNISEEESKWAFLKLCGAEWTNPAISVVGEAIFNMLEKMGVQPDAVAAHSFGDVSSMRAAGILSDEDMIRVTQTRGDIGGKCPDATRGCILIVPDSSEKVREVFKAYELRDVWIANYNTPTQTVLSGVKEAIYKAQAAFDKEGIVTRLIPISAAPHCPLAQRVAGIIGEYLDALSFKPAVCDVYSFVFGRRVKENNPHLFKKLLSVQIEKPVHFEKQIRNMYNDGVRIFVEVAPAGILTNLVRQILDDAPHIAVNTDERKGDAVLTFLNAIAELYKEGRVQNFQVLWEGYKVPQIALDDRTRTLDDTNVRQLKKLDLEFAKMEKTETLRRAV